MTPVIGNQLANRVSSLAARLKDSRGRLERNLSARLLAIADTPESERQVKIRGSLFLADWNLFQVTVNGYQALADGLREHLNPTVRALAAEFEEDVTRAKDAQDVIRALLES